MKKPGREKFRVALIQVNAGCDWRRNLTLLRPRLKRALRHRPDLIALPELFYWRGPVRDMRRVASEISPRLFFELTQFSKKYAVALLLGSLLEASHTPGKFFNTSYLLTRTGRVAARYRKIHLFDAALAGQFRMRESHHMIPGKHAVTGKAGAVRIGLSICYDLRFPELYRKLCRQGARILTVPANFTRPTGKAHWETLLRARAIENQAFVIAPAQIGKHPATGIVSFGTSLAIDPWGRILCRGTEAQEQTLVADLNLFYQNELRKSFPVLRHRRLQS